MILNPYAPIHIPFRWLYMSLRNHVAVCCITAVPIHIPLYHLKVLKTSRSHTHTSLQLTYQHNAIFQMPAKITNNKQVFIFTVGRDRPTTCVARIMLRFSNKGPCFSYHFLKPWFTPYIVYYQLILVPLKTWDSRFSSCGPLDGCLVWYSQATCQSFPFPRQEKSTTNTMCMAGPRYSSHCVAFLSPILLNIKRCVFEEILTIYASVCSQTQWGGPNNCRPGSPPSAPHSNGRPSFLFSWVCVPS